MATSGEKGLLLVTMEPPAGMEDEFQAWYDTEHVPQRQSYPGFETAARWVCLDGWPRWLATYDLESVDAVTTPEYAASNGANMTPWTKRIIAHMVGRRRVVARQIWPGADLSLAAEKVSRLLVARYPSDMIVPDRSLMAAIKPDPTQLRIFTAPGETWLLAAFDRPLVLADLTAAYGEIAGHGATLFNLYAPYRRS